MDEERYLGTSVEIETTYDYGGRAKIFNSTRESLLIVPFKNYPLLS